MPRLVAANTWPPPQRSRPTVVASTSLPPPRGVGENVPVTGFASRYTPEPTYDVPPVLASPIAYQSEPSPASCRSPPLRDGSEALSGVKLAPAVDDVQAPPLAPAA